MCRRWSRLSGIASFRVGPAVSGPVTVPGTGQRGVAWPQGAGVDIGAFEFAVSIPPCFHRKTERQASRLILRWRRENFHIRPASHRLRRNGRWEPTKLLAPGSWSMRQATRRSPPSPCLMRSWKTERPTIGEFASRIPMATGPIGRIPGVSLPFPRVVAAEAARRDLYRGYLLCFCL